MTTGALRADMAPDGQRRSASAYAFIKQRLLDGDWRSGEQISVEELKGDLGVSKQPVMDALRRLSVEGLVDIIPQIGCRVATYTQEEIADFFHIFGGVEAETTAVAANRGTPEQVDQLVRINAEIAKVIEEPDPSRRVHSYMMLNRQFHDVIQQMCASRVAERFGMPMRDICDLLINAAAPSRPIADQIAVRHADHEKIIEALRNGDATAARRQMRAHIMRNIAMLKPARLGGVS